MDEELDLLDLFFAFWKKRVWLLIAIILGAVLGFSYTKFIVTPKYSSSVTLLLSKSSGDRSSSKEDAITQSDIALNQKLISTYSEIMKSRRVSNTVIDNLKLDMTYSEIIRCIGVSSVKDTDVIKLTITTKSPELSAKVADEMTKVFIKEVAIRYNMKNISVLDEAEVDTSPVNVSYAKNIVIFALGLFVLAAVVVFLMYYFDNTIKTEENVQKLTGLPVLASIPKVAIEKKKGGNKND